MKKSSLRAFGIACFLIGLLLTFSEKMNLSFIMSQDTVNEKQYKTQIAHLEQQLDEAKKQVASLEKTEEDVQLSTESTVDNTASENVPSKSGEDDTTSEDTVSDTLYIYGGLTPAEVAQKLKDMNIIKNSIEMELFLAQPEYATSLQKGQYNLNSSMTIEEIANIITGKTKND
ncbi:MAG TPA: hypothetical protein VNS08_13205 [Ureibacillus sp.]|nr:hypothetical protein [Ureibacillus sp.]